MAHGSEQRLKPGELVRLINSDGEIEGIAIYMDIHSPHSLDPSATKHSACWCYSVIDASGQIKYLNATEWTPVPADA